MQMLAQLNTAGLVGLDAVPITVEVDISSKGLPSFTIVGLPDKAVEESKERVRAAIKNSGAEFPPKRITVNLAPADFPKSGPAFDLPIALGILIASGQVSIPGENTYFLGELSLDGSVRHVNGVLSIAMLIKNKRNCSLFIPLADNAEASVIGGITVYPVPTLLSLYRHLQGLNQLTPSLKIPFSDLSTNDHISEFDFADIRGQEHVKRAVEIAASGGHNLFMQGPPGAGKTMIARTIPTILPALTESEALEVTRIYSVTGNLPSGQSIITSRPFRSPHHTTSRVGLIGGGTHPMPGEISLAHRGVLFLDEFPEYPRHVLEALRQPVEDGMVTISRASGTVSFPSKMTLIAAANPCPCGNYGSSVKECTCPPGAMIRYQKRISGPIIDRIDLHVNVPAVEVEALTDNPDNNTAETSIQVQSRVQKARNRQIVRFQNFGISSNAEMTTKIIRQTCELSADTLLLLKKAVVKMNLSARSFYRIIKVARTIADLEGTAEIIPTHIAEALQYRPQKY